MDCGKITVGVNVMKILICDDELYFVKQIKEYISEYFSDKSAKADIDSFSSARDVIYGDKAYDIAFLDIQMKDTDGIDLAKALKERNRRTIIFFITSYKKYQDDAMDVKAFRFFEKPVDKDRLFSGLDKALEVLEKSYIDFFLCSGGEYKKVPLNEVVYVERGNRQVVLVTEKEKYITRETFDHWADTLKNSYFQRVHKSYIVNFHYVTSYKYSELTLLNNIRIPIASHRQSDVRKAWFEYLRRR